MGAAEPAAGRPSLLQDDFPFQGACIGAPFPSNNVAMKGLAIYTSGRDQIGVSPDGQVTSSDNEGTWVPTTPIHWIKPHQFCGVINKLTLKETAAGFVPPLCWLAKSYDNSGGGQIWVTSER